MKFDKIDDYIIFQIDLLTSLNMIKLPPLTKKPKQFYINCIKLYHQGVDISSIDASENLRDMMGWDTTNDVYTYRTNLKKDGWLVEDKTTVGGYNIMPFFRKVELVKQYEFTIQCTDINFNKR